MGHRRRKEPYEESSVSYSTHSLASGKCLKEPTDCKVSQQLSLCNREKIHMQQVLRLTQALTPNQMRPGWEVLHIMKLLSPGKAVLGPAALTSNLMFPSLEVFHVQEIVSPFQVQEPLLLTPDQKLPRSFEELFGARPAEKIIKSRSNSSKWGSVAYSETSVSRQSNFGSSSIDFQSNVSIFGSISRTINCEFLPSSRTITVDSRSEVSKEFFEELFGARPAEKIIKSRSNSSEWDDTNFIREFQRLQLPQQPKISGAGASRSPNVQVNKQPIRENTPRARASTSLDVEASTSGAGASRSLDVPMNIQPRKILQMPNTEKGSTSASSISCGCQNKFCFISLSLLSQDKFWNSDKRS